MIPEIPYPALGVNAKVYGNILDMYSSPTYTVKLYMLTEPSTLSDTEGELSATRGNTQSSGAPSAIILAQTGVTGNQIDNVEIETLSGADTATPTRISFTITQPGAATFLDEIQIARRLLQHNNTSYITMYLEIAFKGYTENIDDYDNSGEPVTIAGPYRYKFALTKFDVNISEAGSTYECEGRPIADYAYRSTIYRLPKVMNTTGATITQHVKDLETQLNDWYSNEVPNLIPDEIEFDLSELIISDTTPSTVEFDGTTSLDIISDDSLIPNASPTVEYSNREQNPNNVTETTGTTQEATSDNNTLPGEEGMTISEWFTMVLTQCPDFRNIATRLAKVDNPTISEVDAAKGFASWIKVNSRVLQLKFDKTRRTYAHRIVFIPTIYKHTRTDMAIDYREHEMTEDDKASRIQQYIANNSLLKGYDYIFTGKNDQILNLDISYNNGIVLLSGANLLSPGEISSESARPAVASGEVAVPFRSTAEVGALQKTDAVLELLSSFSPAQIIATFTDQLGLNPIDAQREAARLQALGAEEFLNTAPPLISNALRTASTQINNSSSPTESREIVTGIDGEYTPAYSGYRFSEEILTENPELIDAVSLGQPDEVVDDMPQEVNRDISVNPKQSNKGPNEVGKITNQLFGVMANQHANYAFLVYLEMTLRGDPWYLGSNNIAVRKSTPAQGFFKKDDNLFLLRVNSPRRYDPDWKDEDSSNNSGYWPNSTSRNFSGVYRMIYVTNKFSSGVYTCDIRAHRLHNIPV